jgi:ligand-binding sensor domain-containing protein
MGAALACRRELCHRCRGTRGGPGWVATHYTVRDGLPVNSVTDLAWSDDGFLWLTTFDGLVRFDGHQFTVHSRATNPSLPANRLTRIRAGARGNMWLATEQGDLVRRSPDGTFTDLTEDEDFPGSKVQCLERDRDGTLWICGDEGIAVLRGGRIERRPSAAGRDVRALLVDAENRIWTAYAHEGVELWESGREVRRFPLSAVGVLRESSSYGILAGAADGLWRLGTDGATKIAGDSPVHEIQEDGFGRLLLQTGDAILRWDGHQVEVLASDGFASKSRGLLLTDALGRRWLHSAEMVRVDGEVVLSSVPNVRAMIEGRNEKESVWVGTGGGLIHLRRSLFTTVGVEEGLDRLGIYPVVADLDGSILAGTPGGGWMSVDPRALAVRVHDEPKQVRTLVRDAGGQLWIGGAGLCRVTPEGCVRESSSPAPLTDVNALHLDRGGAMWVGAREGLYRRDRVISFTSFGT